MSCRGLMLLVYERRKTKSSRKMIVKEDVTEAPVMDCCMVSEQLPACQEGCMNSHITVQRKFRSLLAAMANGGPLEALSKLRSYRITVHTWDQKTKRCSVCLLCRKQCQKNSYLNSHPRTHTGEEPFDCDPCGKRLNPKQISINTWESRQKT